MTRFWLAGTIACGLLLSLARMRGPAGSAVVEQMRALAADADALIGAAIGRAYTPELDDLVLLSLALEGLRP